MSDQKTRRRIAQLERDIMVMQAQLNHMINEAMPPHIQYQCADFAQRGEYEIACSKCSCAAGTMEPGDCKTDDCPQGLNHA